MFSANQLSEIINAYIAGLDFARQPLGLYDPIAYVLSGGGKRIRPVLMMMAYNLYKDDVQTILPQAAGIEVYHNYTLLHDDLMDNADRRRGKATVHKVWDNNTAILSGDAMLVLAYRYMSQSGAPCMGQVIDLFSQTALEICEGQQYDVDFESRDDVGEEEYIEMIRLKTSVLLACALKVGALMAGAPESDADCLYEFGISMGLSFQLKDDYLDVYGNPEVFGKNIGGDIVSNKKTYMLIQAFRHADPSQREQLERWVAATDFDPQEKIAAVTRLYDEIGIRQLCQAKMEAYSQRAASLLDGLQVAAGRKKALRELLDSMLKREV